MNLVFIDAAEKIYFTDEICYSYLQRSDSVMKTPKLSHIDDFFGLLEREKPFIERLGLLKTKNKKELFGHISVLFLTFTGFATKPIKCYCRILTSY